MTLIIAGDRIARRMAGPSIRALEIARALHARGLSVTLAAPGEVALDLPFPTVGYDVRGEALRAAAAGATSIFIQGLTLAQYPFLASLDVPIVVDLYDPFVLENLHARVHDTPSGRRRGHETDLAALVDQLKRGDFFVCASEIQRDYWLGCLTAVGRINPAVYDGGADLRHLIDLLPFGLPDAPPAAPTTPVLRGVHPRVGPDDRVLLWGGGIWDWFDPLTLIRAVADIARERDDVRLYFMGTRTPSLYSPKQTMADKAVALARDVGLLDRVVLLNDGWVDYDGRAGYLLEADIAVSTHLPHVETRYAYRTRLLDCIWTGLPMLVTDGDVLAEVVRREGLGEVVAPNDVAAAADALRRMLAVIDAAEARGDATRGRAAYGAAFDRVRASMTWSAATTSLARFAAAPVRAADRPTGEGDAARAAATPMRGLPRRAVEIVREAGVLALVEEGVRWVRWRRRGR
ncbi:MAG: glycosyltransferase family 4 protein [Ardenticatenales bacterium]|nr:glycosyltransferase family 4 protein [Ardenticatenales bacterium]